jgi:hypothetical protein
MNSSTITARITARANGNYTVEQLIGLGTPSTLSQLIQPTAGGCVKSVPARDWMGRPWGAVGQIVRCWRQASLTTDYSTSEWVIDIGPTFYGKAVAPSNRSDDCALIGRQTAYCVPCEPDGTLWTPPTSVLGGKTGSGSGLDDDTAGDYLKIRLQPHATLGGDVLGCPIVREDQVLAFEQGDSSWDGFASEVVWGHPIGSVTMFGDGGQVPPGYFAMDGSAATADLPNDTPGGTASTISLINTKEAFPFGAGTDGTRNAMFSAAGTETIVSRLPAASASNDPDYDTIWGWSVSFLKRCN